MDTGLMFILLTIIINPTILFINAFIPYNPPQYNPMNDLLNPLNPNHILKDHSEKHIPNISNETSQTKSCDAWWCWLFK